MSVLKESQRRDTNFALAGHNSCGGLGHELGALPVQVQKRLLTPSMFPGDGGGSTRSSDVPLASPSPINSCLPYAVFTDFFARRQLGQNTIFCPVDAKGYCRILKPLPMMPRRRSSSQGRFGTFTKLAGENQLKRKNGSDDSQNKFRRS